MYSILSISTKIIPKHDGNYYANNLDTDCYILNYHYVNLGSNLAFQIAIVESKTITKNNNCVEFK